MKKFTLQFSLVVLIVFTQNTAKAQFPIITSVNQLHSIGDSIHYVDLNTFGFDPIPAGGANVVWNYSSLFASGTTADFVYRNPATTTSAASYPTANAALEISTVAGNEWYLETATSIKRLGLSSPDPAMGDLVYNAGSFIRYKFPFTAGQSWSTPSYTGTQSGDFGIPGTIITVGNGSFSASVDAFGTMTLPGGAVLDSVVRIHINEQFDYLADMGGTPLNLGTVSDDYYYWFKQTKKDPVFIYGITTVTGGGAPTKVLRYQPMLTTSVNELNAENNTSIYPNPGKGIYNVNITNIENGNYTLKVINVLGETVREQPLDVSKNKIENQINISDLNKGMYFIHISNGKSQTTTKVIFE